MDINRLFEELCELEESMDCVSGCSMDCPYYISANYGFVCALSVVMDEVGIKVRDSKPE